MAVEEEETPPDSTTQTEDWSEEKFINIAAFFVFGFVTLSIGIVFLTTTEDLLAGTSFPSTMILVAAIVPYVLCAAILPNVVERVSQLAVTLVVILLFTAGLLMIALSKQTELKILGVVTITLGTGAGEILYLGHTARYNDVTVRAFSGGTGFGFMFSNLYYTGMTTWLCISPSTTLLVLLAMPPQLLVFYCLMEKKQSTKYAAKTTAHNDILYSALDPAKEALEHSGLTCKEKVQVVWENGVLWLSFFIGYFCEYITVQAIVTTLSFPSAPFDPRNHYQYYTVVFMTGEFVGRSYGLLVSLLKCKIPDVTSHTWIFTLIIFVNALFLVFASWYRFLNSVYIVLAALFFIGLNAGALYCSTFTVASRGSSSRHIQFSRSFLMTAEAGGVLCAALLGLYVEPLLVEHCEITLNASSYCLTRWMHEWNATFSC